MEKGMKGFPELWGFPVLSPPVLSLALISAAWQGYVSGVSLGAVWRVWRCRLWNFRVMEVLHVA